MFFDPRDLRRTWDSTADDGHRATAFVDRKQHLMCLLEVERRASRDERIDGKALC